MLKRLLDPKVAVKAQGVSIAEHSGKLLSISWKGKPVYNLATDLLPKRTK